MKLFDFGVNLGTFFHPFCYSDTNKRQSNDIEAQEITKSLKQLFAGIDNSQNDSLPPFMFHIQLQKYYPQFAERDPQTNGLLQHDANECWSLIMRNMQTIMDSV